MTAEQDIETKFLRFLSSQGTSDMEPSENNDVRLMMVLWFVALVVFLSIPFCSNKQRRKLCLRRLRERRWIQNEEEFMDDWYRAAVERRNARRLRIALEQQQFQTSRTQEDEIREQYLVMLMEKYSMTLKETHIHQMENANEEGLSELDDTQKSLNASSSSPSTNDTVSVKSSHSETDYDIEGQQPIRKQRGLSVSSEEDEELLELDMEDINEQISIPMPGQPKATEEEAGAATHRLVQNGCAICLSAFVPSEQIVWSSNPECLHVFHHHCLLHWFHASGRRAQKRRLRNNPEMNDEEQLNALCNFSKNCPCCRQTFCVEEKSSKAPEQEEASPSEAADETLDPSSETQV